MPPNPRPAYRGAKATSTGLVTPTPGLATVSTSTPVMASASSQLATLTALPPPKSSQGTSGNVQGPKRMRYNFLKYTQPPVATELAIEVINNANNAMDVNSPPPTTQGRTSFLDKINRIAPLPCQAIMDAPQSAAPPIAAPSHMSPISVPSPRPAQEVPQSVDPPVFVPSHISPASVPSPPPSKEASQSAAPLQVPQAQSLPESEEDMIEHMACIPMKAYLIDLKEIREAFEELAAEEW
ncbi:hypothetical protein EI94DRAFT_1697897 [Lactarius quietus]|nr:hypothetical protein EI94DRAFT_1697897 [Lactarius quietus]